MASQLFGVCGLRSYIMVPLTAMAVLVHRRFRFCAACGAVASLLLLFTSTGHIPHTVNSLRSNTHAATNRTLGFEKIFVLNMPERYDKRDAMSLSASVSDFSFEWLKGVDGSTMTPKSKPPLMESELSGSNNTLGCWRAHMEALQFIVKGNIQSALILEDDADWDTNIKQLMLNLARGSKFVQGSEDSVTRSPYGNDWDLLWVGHCGVYQDLDPIKRHYVTLNDPTVVPPKHFVYRSRHPDLDHPDLSANYTRTVFKANGGLCTTGYAVSQRGARKLLSQETQSFTKANVADRALARFCNDKSEYGTNANCIATWPGLFMAHRAPGPKSKDSDRLDIDNGRWRNVGETPHVVFSTRMNLDRKLRPHISSQTSKITQSQWPDDTMLNEYTGELQLPKGRGLVINLEKKIVATA